MPRTKATHCEQILAALAIAKFLNEQPLDETFTGFDFAEATGLHRRATCFRWLYALEELGAIHRAALGKRGVILWRRTARSTALI